MPRASKTANRKRTALSPSPADDDASARRRPDEVEADQPKPKRARKAAARVRGRRGAMSAFTNIPVDLLYDICYNLEPRDLLALSTTSKVFRLVVTGASSGPLWVAARERVGLPELEYPMTDLQYAHLLFGKGCSFCSRKNAGKPEVYFRARICSACMREKFADIYSSSGAAAFDKAIGGTDRIHPFTLLVANHTTPDPRRRVPHYLIEEVARVDAELHRRFPESSVHTTLGDGPNSIYFVLGRTSGGPRSQADPAPVTETSSPFYRWWFAEREDEKWAKQEDAIKLNKWITETQQAQAANKEDLRAARRKEIVRRFEDQGFKSKEFNREFYRHSHLTKPELLAERTWTTVEATLKPLLLASRSAARRSFFQDQIVRLAKADASVFAAYYPYHRVDLSSLPAWAEACSVDGFVELEELWASRKGAIIAEVDELVRSRIKAMLRALATAYAEAVSAQEQEDVEYLMPAAQPSSIRLPPLPSFIPRSADEPIVATDEQLVDFLGKHPLSFFVTSCCGNAHKGDAAFKHASNSHCVIYQRVDVAAWALCGQGGRNDLKVDGTKLLRLLHLQEIFDSTDLVPTDGEIEHAVNAYELDVIYPRPEDRMVKIPECGCGMYLSGKVGQDPLSHVYRHIVSPGSSLVDHVVTVKVGYTSKLLQALYRAELDAGVPHPLGEYDYMAGARDWITVDDEIFFGGGMWSDSASSSDSEDGYARRRDDCCVM